MTTCYSLLRLILPLVLIGVLLSAIAAGRGISPVSYWAVPLGAVVPWCLATLVVLLAALWVPEEHGPAATMTGLFPLLGTVGVFLLGALVSLVLSPQMSGTVRFMGAMAISGVPALLGVIFLLAVFVAGD